MKKSFRNPVTNVLTAWGYAASNGDDLARDEPDDFDLEPGRWRLESDQWVAVPPDVANLKSDKLREINADFEASITATKNGYPLSEMLTWDKQEREARAYLADSTARTPFIDALCAERLIPKDSLVTRIMVKVEAAEAAVGTNTGKRQRLEDQLYAIADTDPDAREKIAAITWDAA